MPKLLPADDFDPACQIPCTFFSSTPFLTVDSSATWLAAACHVNRIVSGRPVARQSLIWPRVKTFGYPCSITTNCDSLDTCEDTWFHKLNAQTNIQSMIIKVVHPWSWVCLISFLCFCPASFYSCGDVITLHITSGITRGLNQGEYLTEEGHWPP